VVFYVLAFLLTRRRRVRAPRESQPAPWTVQQTYLGLIDEVTEAHERGVLDSRAAHQRLSEIVREFSARSRGVRAPYMTLSDLRHARIDALADTVQALYPGEFGPGDVPVAQTADRARWLVTSWS
jgi:hypothetical protein